MSDFTYLPIRDILINREERQRESLSGVEELAESIRQYGLINPVLVDRNNVLVAGEHRVEAFRLLGFETIPVHYTDEQDEMTLHVLELEENIRRTDLDWKDRTRAIALYHRTKKEQNEDWSQNKTAAALQISNTLLGEFMLVNDMIEQEVPEVLAAPKFSVAKNFSTRKRERAKTAFMRDLGGASAPTMPTPDADVATPPDATDGPHTPPLSPPTARRATIDQTDFLRWSTQVQERPFNFIHCDFPYGVSAGDKVGQSSAKSMGGYADSADIYFALLEALCNNGINFISPSAHMVFWFSMDYYTETVEALRAAEWRVDPFPLIWHKTDNAGILPDANRGPRRTYETALFCTRGDRKIVRAVANSIGTGTTKRYHMSEKAEVMLDHFFRMLVDETTRMLDPTCGSGMAVRAAERAGADLALGLEQNADFAESARQNLERSE